MMLIGDPAATPMFGFETGLGINFKRFSAGRIGVSVNLGYLTHPAETYHTRNVFLVGGEAYAGVRLGKSVLELLFRTGLVAAAIHQYDQTLWLPKLHVGSSLFIALTRGGSGLSFGFDVYFLSGASFVPRIGFIL